MVLSYKFLQVRYKFVHIFGVVVCVLGLGGLVLTDVLTENGVNNMGMFIIMVQQFQFIFNNAIHHFTFKHTQTLACPKIKENAILENKTKTEVGSCLKIIP